MTAAGWVTWDVTALVRTKTAGDGVVSVMLRDNSQSNKMARLDSRESANAPVIVVN